MKPSIYFALAPVCFLASQLVTSPQWEGFLGGAGFGMVMVGLIKLSANP
jgi:hypothetical protein